MPESKNALPLDKDIIKEHLNITRKDYVLKGLVRGGVGFLIAPPDTGKSHLCLTIAYELATGCDLLSVSQSSQPLRTLLWLVEDCVSETLIRVETHLPAFTKRQREKIAEGVSIYTRNDPICQRTPADPIINSAALEELICAAKDFDLLIIDTLRVAIGTTDEVKDDSLIRQTLNKLATEADVALLVVHHPTKNVSRGNDVINSVSGSGLSSTLSQSKLHFYLNKLSDKAGKVTTTLQHIKANYVSRDDRIETPVRLKWTENSLLCKSGDTHLPGRHASTSKRVDKDIDSALADAEKQQIIEIPDDPVPLETGMAYELARRMREK